MSDARLRALSRIASRVDPDGGVRDRCESRVLESALVLTLLRRTDSHHGAQERVVRYLEQAEVETGSLEDVILTAVLVRGQDHKAELPSWLTNFGHFTAPRKRLMFRTIIAVLRRSAEGSGSSLLPPDPEEFRYGGNASWGDLTLCALKVLSSHLLGRPDGLAPQDSAYLARQLEEGSRCDIWECYLLGHALALLALHTDAPDSPIVARHVERLVLAQNADGGFPFVTGLEIFCTATAGLAMIGGDRHDLLLRMSDYLVNHQQEDGGWAYAEGVRQTDVDDTAYCLQFLRKVAPRRHCSAIVAAEHYLVDIANADGGMPTFRRGHPSETAMTAGALEALAPAWDRHPSSCRAAADHLLESQAEDGSFGRSWSLCETNAIFRAVAAFRCADTVLEDPRLRYAIDLAVQRLRDTQNADGGWGQVHGLPSDTTSTSYAVLALGEGEEQMRTAASRYLIAEQRNHGGFAAPTDLAAPRPLPYDFPVVAEINALWALMRMPVLK